MPKTAFSDDNVIIYADEQTNSGVFTTVEYIRHRCIWMFDIMIMYTHCTIGYTYES